MLKYKLRLKISPIIKIIIYLFVIFNLYNCSNHRVYDWQEKYLSQEKSRIITVENYYEFKSIFYKLISSKESFETFNKKGQKISWNNNTFYKYDSIGNIIEEEYCTRTCDFSGKIKYYYDKKNRLYKTTVIYTKDNVEQLKEQYFYSDNDLLIKKIFCSDSLCPIEYYTYDDLHNLKKKIRVEHNGNVNKWVEYIDTMFYDNNKNLIRKERREKGIDLLTISKYFYNTEKLLISQIDTTITTIKSYMLTKDTDSSPYYGRTDYKYNNENKIIEKIIFQSDYKTPSIKFTYEYK